MGTGNACFYHLCFNRTKHCGFFVSLRAYLTTGAPRGDDLSMTPVQGVCQLASDQGKAGGGEGRNGTPKDTHSPRSLPALPAQRGLTGGGTLKYF